MGRAKAYMAEMEDRENMARGIAEEEGAIKQCPLHEDILINVGDPGAVEEAKVLAAKRHAEGIIDGDLSAFQDLIEEVVLHSTDECGYCAKIRDS